MRITTRTVSERQVDARMSWSRILALAFMAPAAASCSGMQSALDPAGVEATQIATLFWVMTAGGFLIWVSVVAGALYASRWKRKPISEGNAGRFIFWGGVVFPVTVLTVLLAYSLWLMPWLRPFGAEEGTGVRVEVVGSQFWWHVVYHRPDGSSVVSANEIRLPVGERIEFSLESADMIHSFWIPALGGKMDMIPGRTNRLSLLATRAGTYRGQCAEFCGISHAYMAFPAIAMESADFETWLDERSLPSTGVGVSSAGRDLFMREGCGTCHRVDGTESQGAQPTGITLGRTPPGTAGPDLSHIGSRLTIGAALLDNDEETLARFIAHSASIKPGSQMPAYPGLTPDELREIAAWLKGLQ
jgi:cytochrome c oxidase subunit 2